MHLQTTFAILLSCSLSLAQTIYVPDNQANVGTCNAIPLSPSFAPATTYVGAIPASYLSLLTPTIHDLEFAPCASGSFSATNLQMGMGHIPTPTPNPFTFPTFDALGNVTSLGSFIDYTPFWNSVSQGPFSFTMTANTWSPMGLGSATPGFTWNGTNDIGFYITYNTASGGGSFHRTTTDPFRLYASGTYQAAASSGSGAAGLKMGLVTGTGASCPGCGPLTMTLAGAPTLGGSVTMTLGNYGNGLPVIGMGFGPFCFANFCNTCTIGHSWLVSAFGSSQTLQIPNDIAYTGLQIGVQGVGLFTPGGCQAPSVALSDTYVLTIL